MADTIAFTDQNPRDAADELRAAADAIRRNARECARPGDRWAYRRTNSHPGYVAHVAAEGDPTWSGVCDVILGSGAEDHIAGADPTVMLAVADLLQVISWMPSYGDQVDLAAAVKVARAYLRAVPAVTA